MCRSPIRLKSDSKVFYVPCQKCAWCLRNKRNEWFFRLSVEKKDHMFSRFITLTYSDLNLPMSIDEESGVILPVVSKIDVQKFCKSIRNDGYKFRYMINSEYDKNGRPHYHGIIFSNEKIDITPYWTKGFSKSLPARDGSLKYVCKYMLKGSNVPEGAEPNFSLMSRRPGIGSSFVYKGEPYILGSNGVHIVPGHYYRRNYLASLNDKLRRSVSEQSIDYLSSTDPYNVLRSMQEKFAPDMDFDTWLQVSYNNDVKQQKKINSK